ADIRIDRERLDDLGVSVQTVAQTLQTMLASREISDWVDRGREYPVILQAREEDRRVPSDIGNIFMRGGDGENLFPLSSVVSVKEAAAAP
ncbi:efflux RND transporter permease subunit, partial [Rhodoplanes roseus]